MGIKLFVFAVALLLTLPVFASEEPLCSKALVQPSRPPILKMAWFAIRNISVIAKLRALPTEKALEVQSLDPYDSNSADKLAEILGISRAKAHRYWKTGLEIRAAMEADPEFVKAKAEYERSLEAAMPLGLSIFTTLPEYHAAGESLIFFSSDNCHPCLVAAPFFAARGAPGMAVTKAPAVRTAAFVSIIPQIVFKNSRTEIRANAAVKSQAEMDEILQAIQTLKESARGLNILRKSESGFILVPAQSITVNQSLFGG